MNQEYYKKCKICDKEFVNPTDFHRHLKGHSIKVDAYLLEYELDGINPTCKCGCGSPTNFDARKGELERGYFRDYVNGHFGKHVQSKEKVIKPPKFDYDPFVCKICGHTSHKPVDFKKHLLEEHDLDIETYTFQYTCEGIQPLCKCGCGEPVRFSFENSLRFNNYYEEYRRHHRPKPKGDKEHVAMRMEATRKAMVEKYGVDNPFKLKTTPDKIKQTKLVKYGNANYTNVEKQIDTKKKLFGIKTMEEKVLEKTMIRNHRERAKFDQSKVKELKIMQNLYNYQPTPTEKEVSKLVDNDPHLCKLCGDVNTIHGMRTHLTHKHVGYNVDKYVKEFGEFRKDYLNKELVANNSGIVCEICREKMTSERALTNHVQHVHGMDKVSYIKKHIFFDEPQLCKCGCGKEVNFIPHGFDDNKNRTYRRNYAKGCSNPIKTTPVITDERREQMRQHAFDRMVGGTNKVDTIGERMFKAFLETNNIKYEHQYKTEFGLVDFYLPEHDLFIEIDGEYYHPTVKERLNIKQLTGAISDCNKFGKVDYRILDTDVKYITSLNDLDNYNRIVQMEIPYDQVIVDKSYFKDVLTRKGEDYLQRHLYLFPKFVRRYFKEFPYPTSNENLENVMETIYKYDTTSIYNDMNKSFSNSCHHVGNSYLKSIFRSYYHSSFKQGQSPVESFYDDKILKTILRYRCGLNDSGEIFDFSAKEIIKGLSAIRSTISFFKPLLASAIYKKFLDCKTSPLVLDPCCGFGGRLLGFKSTYPNGIYVGCEPNFDTYTELLELSKDMEDVFIYNCRFEDFDDLYDNSYDLVFTSIPYYDLETYSIPQVYENIEEWEQTFIKSLKRYNNLCLNVPKNLEYLFNDMEYDTYYINQSKAKQFDKRVGSKSELLLKFK